jgi:hypothetical protein
LSDVKEPDIFLTEENQVPPFACLRELEAASLRIEKRTETDEDLQYKRWRQTLSFDGESSSPSLDLCIDLAPYFDVDEQLINYALKYIDLALKSWKGAAKKNQLEAEEIKRFESAFVHDDSEKLIALMGTNRKSLELICN